MQDQQQIHLFCQIQSSQTGQSCNYTLPYKVSECSLPLLLDESLEARCTFIIRRKLHKIKFREESALFAQFALCMLAMQYFNKCSKCRLGKERSTIHLLLMIIINICEITFKLQWNEKMGRSWPLFLYFRLFNTQLTVNKCSINFCRWLDLNHGLMVLEVTALPTEPQPLPQINFFN